MFGGYLLQRPMQFLYQAANMLISALKHLNMGVYGDSLLAPLLDVRGIAGFFSSVFQVLGLSHRGHMMRLLRCKNDSLLD